MAVVGRIPMAIDAPPVGSIGGIEEVNRGPRVVPSVVDEFRRWAVECVLNLIDVAVGEIDHHLDHVLSGLYGYAVILRLGEGQTAGTECAPLNFMAFTALVIGEMKL